MPQIVKIDCIYNDHGAWCKNTQVERSLLGFGPRMCVIYYNGRCKHQKKYPNPIAPPPKGGRHV